METISTLPLLILFNASWIVSIFIFFLVKDRNRKVPFIFLMLISSIFIISSAPIEIRCLDCNCTEDITTLENKSYFNETTQEWEMDEVNVTETYNCVTVSRPGIFPIEELFIAHAILFIPLEILFLIYYVLTGGFSALQKGLRGQI